MTKYTTQRVSYVREGAATYGTSAITAAADASYFMGAVSEASRSPSPRWLTYYVPPDVNSSQTPAGGSHKSFKVLRGLYGVTLQNGVPLEWIMGESSTAALVHTIVTPTDGAKIPSITIQHDRTGTATDWPMQFRGVKVNSMTLTISEDIPRLLCMLDVVAQDSVDPGWIMTTTPALPATATTDGYYFNGMTRTWDYGVGNTSLDGLIDMKLTVEGGLRPYYDQLDPIPLGYDENPRRHYTCVMHLHPNTVEQALWDESLLQANDSEMYFKFTKSVNDYIEIEMTTCKVVNYSPEIPINDLIVDEVVMECEDLEFRVKDALAGSAYGE